MVFWPSTVLVAERRSEGQEEQVIYSVGVRDSVRERGGGEGGDCDSERGVGRGDAVSVSGGER